MQNKLGPSQNVVIGVISQVHVITRFINSIEQNPSEKLIVAHLVKFPAFYGIWGSTLCSQDPATGP